MTTQNIKEDFNTAIPFVLWLQAIIMFYHFINHIILYFHQSLLFLYLFTFIAIILFVISGINLRAKKRSALIMYWVIIVSSLFLPIILLLPSFVSGSRYFIIIINVTIAGYLTFTNWKKWNPRLVENK